VLPELARAHSERVDGRAGRSSEAPESVPPASAQPRQREAAPSAPAAQGRLGHPSPESCWGKRCAVSSRKVHQLGNPRRRGRPCERPLQITRRPGNGSAKEAGRTPSDAPLRGLRRQAAAPVFLPRLQDRYRLNGPCVLGVSPFGVGRSAYLVPITKVGGGSHPSPGQEVLGPRAASGGGTPKSQSVTATDAV
jgi:hypothetical protein